MRRKIFVIGLVLLVVGVGIFFGAVYAATSLTHVSTTLKESSSGEWISGQLNTTGTSSIVVVTSTGNFGVVPAGDISSVNASNIGHYAISPNETIGSLHTAVYSDYSGQYVLVAFGASQPTVEYSVIANFADELELGLLFLIAVSMAIAGFVIAIIGALMKPKPLPEFEF